MKINLILLGLIVMFCFSCKNSGTDTAQTTDSLKTVSEPVLKKMMIIAKLTVKADKVKDFTEVAKEMIEKSNQEPGCKFYQLYQSPYDATKLTFVEEYADSNAVNAHFNSEYFKAFGPKIKDLVDGPSDVKIITVDSEK